MKKLLLFLFFFYTNFVIAIPYLYIPENGIYVKSDISLKGMSRNKVSTLLGYGPGLFYSWISNDKSISVLFKILSSDIICVITDKDYGPNIKNEKIQKILKDNDYDYFYDYTPYDIENDLEKGIVGKYITESFIEEVTGKKVQQSKLLDEINGYIYYFENGIMKSFESSDGYNKWAKESRKEDWFKFVKLNAEKYNSKEEDIIAEINMQCEYNAKINFDDLNLVSDYNYALLYVDLNCPNISLDKFNQIVHNRAATDSITNLVKLYKGKKYIFNKEKILIKIEGFGNSKLLTPPPVRHL